MELMALAKAELHVHLEGTLEPDMLLALARKNQVSVPYANREEVLAAYRFGSLDAFLKLYYAGMAVLRTPEDFTALTESYFDKVAGQGVKHAELFFDPQAHRDKGLTFAQILAGIEEGCRRARARHGISSLLIPCILRHLDPDAALRLVDEMLPHKDRIVAVGLDSSEQGRPPSLFVQAFQRVRDVGLKTVAHAGEEGPAEYIQQAIDLLGVSRIDHGVRILDDAALTKWVARAGIPLTVCPVCNVRLGVFGTLEQHNVPQLIEAGLAVTLHSDDPAYIQSYIGDNYVACAQRLGIQEGTLRTIARRSFTASFLPEAERKRLSELVS
ncbi:MAG: adenosine deaminase [Gemmataceae bacterium]